MDDWNTWAKQTKQHFKIGDICIYSSVVLTVVGLLCAAYELFLCFGGNTW